MKKYLFCDCNGNVAEEMLFNREAKAVDYAQRHWNIYTTESERQEYKDKSGEFAVYEIEMTDEDLHAYNDEDSDINAKDFVRRVVLDMLNGSNISVNAEEKTIVVNIENEFIRVNADEFGSYLALEIAFDEQIELVEGKLKKILNYDDRKKIRREVEYLYNDII